MDIFCKIITGEIPGKTVYEDETVIVIMDINPRSNGHLLVIPKKHYQDIYDIETKTLNHILEIAKKMSKILTEKLNCQGITLEENNGSCQEVKHFHLHIIPRYEEKEEKSIEEIYNILTQK